MYIQLDQCRIQTIKMIQRLLNDGMSEDEISDKLLIAWTNLEIEVTKRNLVIHPEDRSCFSCLIANPIIATAWTFV